MNKSNPLVDKSEKLALDIIDLTRILMRREKEYVLSKQLVRSGTSIGANIAEAQFASSKKDFAAKLFIALKEARETHYWINLLQKSNYIKINDSYQLLQQVTELIKILIASIKTTQKWLYIIHYSLFIR